MNLCCYMHQLVEFVLLRSPRYPYLKWVVLASRRYPVLQDNRLLQPYSSNLNFDRWTPLVPWCLGKIFFVIVSYEFGALKWPITLLRHWMRWWLFLSANRISVVCDQLSLFCRIKAQEVGIRESPADVTASFVGLFLLSTLFTFFSTLAEWLTLCVRSAALF